MRGVAAGEMVKAALADDLKVKLEGAPICPNCAGQVRVESFVLLRPVEGKCLGCKKTWRAPAVESRLCTSCGYSEDHREGYGCLPSA